MANAVFDAFKQGLLNADYDLNTAAVKVALVRGYTFNPAHATLADVVSAGATVNGVSAALANPTIAGGVFDADDTLITTSASAANHYLLIFQASSPTGGTDLAPEAQRLIAYFDTGSGLPIQPGNGTVSITWANTANRIVRVG